jgi:hypothetical protein
LQEKRTDNQYNLFKTMSQRTQSEYCCSSQSHPWQNDLFEKAVLHNRIFAGGRRASGGVALDEELLRNAAAG